MHHIKATHVDIYSWGEASACISAFCSRTPADPTEIQLFWPAVFLHMWPQRKSEPHVGCMTHTRTPPHVRSLAHTHAHCFFEKLVLFGNEAKGSEARGENMCRHANVKWLRAPWTLRYPLLTCTHFGLNIQVNIWQKRGLLEREGSCWSSSPYNLWGKGGLITRSHTLSNTACKVFRMCTPCCLFALLWCSAHFAESEMIYLNKCFAEFRSDSKVRSVWTRRRIKAASACWLTVCWFNVFAERERGREGVNVRPLTHWTFMHNWQRHGHHHGSPCVLPMNPPHRLPSAEQQHKPSSQSIILSSNAPHRTNTNLLTWC